MATGVVWRVRYTNRQKMALYCTLYYPLAKSVAMRRGRSGRAAESEKPSARSFHGFHDASPYLVARQTRPCRAKNTKDRAEAA
jgi:hypothetical protein